MVCVLIYISRGVFIGVQGGVTDLVESVTCQVVAGQPCGSASTDFLYRLGLLFLVLTRVHEDAGQTDIKPGRPATPWAHWSMTFVHYLLVSGTSPG
jgi:hypothetical protein